MSASAPVRTISVLARAPASSDSESTTIDLPAPVSPESTLKPRPELDGGFGQDGQVADVDLAQHAGKGVGWIQRAVTE